MSYIGREVKQDDFFLNAELNSSSSDIRGVSVDKKHAILPFLRYRHLLFKTPLNPL